MQLIDVIQICNFDQNNKFYQKNMGCHNARMKNKYGDGGLAAKADYPRARIIRRNNNPCWDEKQLKKYLG